MSTIRRTSGDTSGQEVGLTRAGRRVTLDVDTDEVMFRLRDPSSTSAQVLDCEIIDSGKKVRILASDAGYYQTPGVYEAQFHVEYEDGTRESFPNGEYIEVVVLDDV